MEENQAQEPQETVPETAETEVQEAEEAGSEAQAEDDNSAPFPRARVVNIMRESIKDKQIRSEVKEAMNFWLGDLLKKLAKEMSNTQYGSVSLADFQRATKPYDMIEDIVKDQQRLLLACEKLGADSDSIHREMKRFFAAIRGINQEEL